MTFIKRHKWKLLTLLFIVIGIGVGVGVYFGNAESNNDNTNNKDPGTSQELKFDRDPHLDSLYDEPEISDRYIQNPHFSGPVPDPIIGPEEFVPIHEPTEVTQPIVQEVLEKMPQFDILPITDDTANSHILFDKGCVACDSMGFGNPQTLYNSYGTPITTGSIKGLCKKTGENGEYNSNATDEVCNLCASALSAGCFISYGTNISCANIPKNHNAYMGMPPSPDYYKPTYKGKPLGMNCRNYINGVINYPICCPPELA